MLKWRKRRHALEPPDFKLLQSYSAGIVSGVDNRFCPCVLKGPGRIWFSGFYIRKHADETEITPLLIRTKLEQYDYAGGTAVAAVMLVISFILLLMINAFQWWAGRHRSR